MGFYPKISSAFCHHSVTLCFSILGNGTLKQPPVTKRLISRISKRWTTCGSPWRRPPTTLCSWLDICTCEKDTLHAYWKLIPTAESLNNKKWKQFFFLTQNLSDDHDEDDIKGPFKTIAWDVTGLLTSGMKSGLMYFLTISSDVIRKLRLGWDPIYLLFSFVHDQIPPRNGRSIFPIPFWRSI